MSSRLATRLIAVVLVNAASPALASKATDIINGAIDGFVRPGYQAFHRATSTLLADEQTLCAAPSQAALDAARKSFGATVDAWSQIEIIRFGPVTEQNRLERVLFWPDRKGTGLKQVQAALASKDPTAADAKLLAGKSVAMQGLGALEFVLFGTGSEELAAPRESYRCGYGRAIAANIASIADEIDTAWRKPDGIATQWSNPGPDNPLYRSADEAMTELFNVFVHGLEMIRDVRINGFLGETPDKDRPRQAIFWRSGATAVSLQANLDGPRDLFEVSGIADGLPSDSAWIADSVAFEFRTADTMLDGLDVGDALADAEARSRLVSVRLITSHLSELFGVNLSAALGLSAGFSSLDGD
jgi:predicted lipoprotein